MVISKILENGFSFCLGEIGVDNFADYLRQVRPIDFVYCSTPNPSTMAYWYKDMGHEPPEYGSFFDALAEVLKMADAPEYHIEGGGNARYILKAFSGMLPYERIRPIVYSAAHGNNGDGLVKRKIAYRLFSFSRQPIEDYSFEYSHEFLDSILSTRVGLRCFDPCVGKGLLTRYALTYGHTCHGIDCNRDRLNTAVRYMRRYLQTASTL